MNRPLALAAIVLLAAFTCSGPSPTRDQAEPAVAVRVAEITHDLQDVLADMRAEQQLAERLVEERKPSVTLQETVKPSITRRTQELRAKRLAVRKMETEKITTPKETEEVYPPLEPATDLPDLTPPARASAPMVPYERDEPQPWTAPSPDAGMPTPVAVALGVGAVGLAMGVVSVSADTYGADNQVFAGVALGVGAVGFATAGILTLALDDDDVEVGAGPGGVVVKRRF